MTPLTMTFAGAYASEVLEFPYLSSYGYNEDDDEYDIFGLWGTLSYTHTYPDGDTFAGTLTLNSQAISNSGGYEDQWIWPPYDAFPRFGFFLPLVSGGGQYVVGLRCSLIPFSTPDYGICG